MNLIYHKIKIPLIALPLKINVIVIIESFYLSFFKFNTINCKINES